MFVALATKAVVIGDNQPVGACVVNNVDYALFGTHHNLTCEHGNAHTIRLVMGDRLSQLLLLALFWKILLREVCIHATVQICSRVLFSPAKQE